jgi:large-conductance mechanosensitive channel
MGGDPSIGGGFLWALHAMSDIALRWIPGTVEIVIGTAGPGYVGSSVIMNPITQPVTTSDVTNFLQATASQSMYDRFFQDWAILVAVAVIISLLCTAAIIYCVIRIQQVREHERAKAKAAAHPVAANDVSKAQLRWNHIVERARSDDEKSWRLAILEADIMLNDLLDVLGYRGDTMADKMKQVGRAKFQTIDLAWDAHRVRNVIAHQGSMQSLTAHETRRVISLYHQVFREFKFVD